MGERREKLVGRRVVASISGGKDSAAMSLWLHEQGIDHDRVFLDTGWEHPATYEYLRGELTRALGPITELRPVTGGMADLVRRKAMFPSRVIRFCTQELKVFPMRDYLRTRMDTGVEPINAVGIRAAESTARSMMTEWEWNGTFDCEIWRPLIRWAEQEVIDIHGRHGLRPNPLYLAGASRVGCWPCIFARKAEIRAVADTDPERIDLIRALEAELTTARGAPRTFFDATRSKALAVAGSVARSVAIDEVVSWSRTANGGRQRELFAPEHEEGCVRWGLCDAASCPAPSLSDAPEGDHNSSRKDGE